MAQFRVANSAFGYAALSTSTKGKSNSKTLLFVTYQVEIASTVQSDLEIPARYEYCNACPYKQMNF